MLKNHGSLISATLICLVGFTIFVFIYERYTFVEERHKADRYSEYSELPLWNQDEESAIENGRLIIQAGSYRSIEIYQTDDMLFISVGKESASSVVEAVLTSLGLIRDYRIVRPIVYRSQTIGRIEILWINTNVYVYIYVLLCMVLFISIVHYYLRLIESRNDLEQKNKELNKEIAERERIESALADEKERLAVTLRSIGDAVITTDTNGRVNLMNSAAESLTGWRQEEAQGRSIDQILKLIDAETRLQKTSPVIQALETENHVIQDDNLILVSKDETERPVKNSSAPIRDKNGRIIGVVLVCQDVTVARQQEEERLKISKLESIGLLAGGIAHDFNNDLTAIMGNLSFAQMDLSPDDPLNEKIAMIEEAAVHAKSLTRQLLSFSRGGEPHKIPTSIANLTVEASSFVLSGSNVRCAFDIPEDLWTAEIDAGQITQVIQNLVINADQAMPKGGIIDIRCSNETVESDMIVQGAALPPGAYVKITIMDQGEGIAPEHLPKIFDPYFTTKPSGTGLGLTTSYTVIRRHNGTITVTSTPGSGTTFEMYLPASSSTRISEQNESSAQRGDTSEKSQGKILVMDDESRIRHLIEKSMANYGYEVVCTEDGQEAVAAYTQALESEDGFDVVIVDLTVPGGMGGKETMARLLSIDPNVKAIVVSGYSDDPVMAKYRDYGFCNMVAKPFRVNELSDIVRQVIHTSENA